MYICNWAAVLCILADDMPMLCLFQVAMVVHIRTEINYFSKNVRRVVLNVSKGRLF